MKTQLIYPRILLKLSGEALMGDSNNSFDPSILSRVATEITEISLIGVQVGVVIGGGNIFRGASLIPIGIKPVAADHIGMLATVINALAMQSALERYNQASVVMSAINIDQICDVYNYRRAIQYLEKNIVTIFAAGTGNPCFTTDSAASLRAIEINANLLIKATKVNGIYSDDPLKNPTAKFYSRLSYDQAIRDNLKVMDMAALILCRDHAMPLRILNIYEPGALMRLLRGKDIGSLVK
jgi:uridylate kinase